MPCQSRDAHHLGVPQELCGAELEPMLQQLRRDMQHWKPRSITPAMLDEIRAAKRDDPVRVALMIVNRTVWYLRPLGTQRSPMVIALVHDLQERSRCRGCDRRWWRLSPCAMEAVT